MHLKKSTELFAFNIVRTAKKKLEIYQIFPVNTGLLLQGSKGIESIGPILPNGRRYGLALINHHSLDSLYSTPSPESRPPCNIYETPGSQRIAKVTDVKQAVFSQLRIFETDFFYSGLRGFLSRRDIRMLECQL
jgi:hypothetical protein